MDNLYEMTVTDLNKEDIVTVRRKC